MTFDKKFSENLAKSIRIHALNMTNIGNSSHIASVLSVADILSVLYGTVLNVRPNQPDWSERDRFILSKGHAGAGVYAALAETGFFSVETLKEHYQNGSILSGHVSHKGVPGVELSTGSLGHGLGVACGIAYAAKTDKEDFRIFNLMSDVECDEGSNWEAALFASHHELSNLVNIVDYNKLQSLDTTESTLALEPFKDKWDSFGWNTLEINGHCYEELFSALTSVSKQPTCIIAHTTKGKGVSFMENSVLWHYRSPQGEEFKKAINELEDA